MVWPCPPSGGEDYAALVGTYTLPDEVAAGKPENEQTTIEITDTCPGLYLATFKKGGSCFSCTPLCCAGHNTWSNYNGLCVGYDGTALRGNYCCMTPAVWAKQAEDSAPKGAAMERTPLNAK